MRGIISLYIEPSWYLQEWGCCGEILIDASDALEIVHNGRVSFHEVTDSAGVVLTSGRVSGGVVSQVKAGARPVLQSDGVRSHSREESCDSGIS